MPEENTIAQSQYIFNLENDPDFLIRFIIDNNPEAVRENVQLASATPDHAFTKEELYTFIITLFEAKQFTKVQEILTVPYNVDIEGYTSNFNEYIKALEFESAAQGLTAPIVSESGTLFLNVKKAIDNVIDQVNPDLNAEDIEKLNLPDFVIQALSKILNLEGQPEAQAVADKEDIKDKATAKRTKAGVPVAIVYVLSGLVVALVVVIVFRAMKTSVIE